MSMSPDRRLPTVPATTKPPLGRNVTTPLVLGEAVVMGAGVRVASGWPAGLNSRWLGKVKMSPLASRPSAVKSELPTCTCPPVPKEVSMRPSALNRASAPKVSGARLVPDGLSGDVLPADEYFPVWLDQDGLGALHAGVE